VKSEEAFSVGDSRIMTNFQALTYLRISFALFVLIIKALVRNF